MELLPKSSAAKLRVIGLVMVLVLAVVGYFVFARSKSSAPRPDPYAADDAFLLRPLPTQHVKLPPVTKEMLGFKQPYKFTTDWLSHDVAWWTVVLAPLKGRPDLHYLEVGVFEGRSLFWVLENILTDPSSKATAIDPLFDDARAKIFFDNIKLSMFEGRINFIKGFSQIELRKLPLESFDLIYIDGSHQADDVLEDAVLSWRLLKPGGMIIFDDYLWNMHDPPEKRPKVSIDIFYRFFGKHFEVVHAGYQMIIRRKP